MPEPDGKRSEPTGGIGGRDLDGEQFEPAGGVGGRRRNAPVTGRAEAASQSNARRLVTTG